MGQSVLMRLNAERCEAEASRVEAAVSRLLNRPAKVDFYSVAYESGVSRSTLYRNLELRSMVESARASQPDPWELISRLVAENRRLRAELMMANTHGACDIMVEYDIDAMPLVA